MTAWTTARRRVAAPLATTFAVLTDLRRHAGAFPFTTVAAPPPPARTGDRYEAVSLGFVRDVMVLDRLATSGSGARRAVYHKVDGVFRGTVVLTAAPVDDGSATDVTWAYDVRLAVGPAALTRPLATVSCALVARLALRHLAQLAVQDAASA
ncbi:hypothetical protein C8046_16145 [Serinibacter arcticus]|uniref:Polyketide cyclase / dehydrase and lipid transport n=1 Tax=Serinibacter arcticus TaxID=1655435 RepID=A0A2U1ZY89_9MICO|nr:hypothetical protein [Serinibacter arcticus]PWD51949.1 hypothetical protein C8046_16145 [Serinibacter arcticus]